MVAVLDPGGARAKGKERVRCCGWVSLLSEVYNQSVSVRACITLRDTDCLFVHALAESLFIHKILKLAISTCFRFDRRIALVSPLTLAR